MADTRYNPRIDYIQSLYAPEDELLKILASDGLMVKRPVLLAGDNVLVGFNEEEWTKVLIAH